MTKKQDHGPDDDEVLVDDIVPDDEPIAALTMDKIETRMTVIRHSGRSRFYPKSSLKKAQADALKAIVNSQVSEVVIEQRGITKWTAVQAITLDGS